MSSKKENSIFGEAFPATLYVLVYTFYSLAFSFQLNVMLIRLSYVVFYVMSFWFFLRTLHLYSNSVFVKQLTITFALVLFYCFLLFLTGTSDFKRAINPSSVLILYLSSVMPMYAFYYFTRKNMLSERWFQIFFFLFCFIAYALYLENQQRAMESLLYEDEGFINNSGYIIVSLLPFVAFFNKKSIFQYIAIFLISLATIICFKRGAILAGAVCILFFFLRKIKSGSITRKVGLVVLGMTVVVLLYRYINQLIQGNDFFYHRFLATTEGNSSGRDKIYGSFLSYYFSGENGFWRGLFGNGMMGTVKIMGIEAHNDWIEFLIDMGLLGLIVYAFYWLILFKYYRYAKIHLSDVVVLTMGLALIINFSRTLFSMSFNDMSFFTASLIGYTTAMVDNEKNR